MNISKFILATLLLTLVISTFGCSTTEEKRVQSLVNNSYSPINLITLEQSALIAQKYFSTPKHGKESTTNSNNWLNSNFLDDYDNCSDTCKMVMRNDLLNELFILSDYNYHTYKLALSNAKRSVDVGTDMYTLLFTGAASLSTGGNTPNILAGIATFITGTKDSFDKSFFAEQTIDTLINIMDGRRMLKKKKLLEKTEKGIDVFSLRMALREVMEMHQQGNIISALTFMQEQSVKYKLEVEGTNEGG